ncbi:MAG: hypothetical protein JNL62_27970, partial [Bryobacterales bacterium]|nr:hypothetical protein [Bryobacterales bacterium]
RNLHITYVQPLAHVEGMLVAYLPKEGILIEADLFDPPATTAPNAENRALLRHVERLGYQVRTIAPIHGRPVAWGEFAKWMQP